MHREGSLQNLRARRESPPKRFVSLWFPKEGSRASNNDTLVKQHQRRKRKRFSLDMPPAVVHKVVGEGSPVRCSQFRRVVTKHCFAVQHHSHWICVQNRRIPKLVAFLLSSLYVNQPETSILKREKPPNQRPSTASDPGAKSLYSVRFEV